MTGVPEAPLGRRRWVIMAPLLCAIACAALSMSLVTVPAPQIASDLSMSDANRAWMIDIYPLSLAVALVAMARLGDRFGRRRVLIGGAAVTALANAGAATASDGALIIAYRGVLGMAGAALIASVVATIGSRFRGRDLAIANGAWVGMVGVGNALGPVLGGTLTDTFGWPSVFVALSVLGVCTVVTAWFLMPDSSVAGRPRWDLLSLLLSGVAIGSIVYGVKTLTQQPLVGVVVGLIGCAALVVFVRRQLASTHPLLDMHLFRIRRLSISAVHIFASASAAGATIYLVSVHLQGQGTHTASEAGLILVALAAGTASGGVIAPRAMTRFSPLVVVRAAVIVQGAGLIVAGLDLVPLPIPLVMIGLGFGAVGTAATTAIFEAATPTRASQAGVIQETSFAVGTGVGIAVFSTIYSAAGAIDSGTAFALALGTAAVTTAGSAFLRAGDSSQS